LFQEHNHDRRHLSTRLGFRFWLVRDQEFVRRCKSALSENKTALFDALARARIDTVEMTFNGYVDNGQIDEAVIDGEGNADIRLVNIEIARVERGNPVVVRETLLVKDAILEAGLRSSPTDLYRVGKQPGRLRRLG
jgi:hypothetical protein